MSNIPESKMQNVKASIEKYIGDNLVTTEGLKVNYEGLQFETDGLAEWVQEDLIGNTSEFHRQVDEQNRYGQTTSILLNFNIFVKKNETKKTNRHYEIRDLISNYFKIGTEINLYDFYNGDFSTVLQVMKIREIVTDRKIPDDNFYQYAYTVSLDWLEKWEV
ncbi:MAG: hypothetical protein FK734_09120 [Asgard group archaeon]|nr:hypothetical protein [Asgard group archaeon]